MMLPPKKILTMTPNWRVLALALAALSLTTTPAPAPAKDPLVLVTAFAPGEKGGIHAYEFEATTGALKPVRRTAGVENPFFLALSPDRKYLYATQATQFGAKENEQVAAYAVVGRTCARTCRGTTWPCSASTRRPGG